MSVSFFDFFFKCIRDCLIKLLDTLAENGRKNPTFPYLDCYQIMYFEHEFKTLYTEMKVCKWVVWELNF